MISMTIFPPLNMVFLGQLLLICLDPSLPYVFGSSNFTLEGVNEAVSDRIVLSDVEELKEKDDESDKERDDGRLEDDDLGTFLI